MILLVGTLSSSASPSHVEIQSQNMRGGQQAISIAAGATQGVVDVDTDAFEGGVVNAALSLAGNPTVEFNFTARHFLGLNVGGSASCRLFGGVSNLSFEAASTTSGPFLTTDPSPDPPPPAGSAGPLVTARIGHLSPLGTTNVVDIPGSVDYVVRVDLRIDDFEFDVAPGLFAVTVRSGGDLSLDVQTMRARNPTVTLSDALLADGSGSQLKCRITQLSCPRQAVSVLNGALAECTFQRVRRDLSPGPILVPLVGLSGNSTLAIEAQEMFSLQPLAAASNLIENLGGFLFITRMGYLRAPAADDTAALIRIGGSVGPPFQFAVLLGMMEVIEGEATGAGVPTLMHSSTLSFMTAFINILQGGKAILMENVQCSANLNVGQISGGSAVAPSIWVRDAASLAIRIGFLSTEGAGVLVENITAVGNTSNANMIFENITAGNGGGPPTTRAVACRGDLGGFAALRLIGGGIAGGTSNDFALHAEGTSTVLAEVVELTAINTPLSIQGSASLRGRFSYIHTLQAPAIYMASGGDSYISCDQIEATGVGSLGLTPQSTILVRDFLPPPFIPSGNLNLQCLMVSTGNGLEYAIRLEGQSTLSGNINNINAEFGDTIGIGMVDTSSLQLRLGYGVTLDDYLLDCQSTGNAQLQFTAIQSATKFGCIHATAGNVLLDGGRLDANAGTNAILLEGTANCTFRIEEIRNIGRSDGPGPVIQMNSSGTLNGRFHTILSVDLGIGATTAALVATAGTTYLQGVLVNMQNANLNAARGFIVSGTANAYLYIERVISQFSALEASNNGETWWIVEQCETSDVAIPVVRLTAPAALSNYTVGGYLRTPAPRVILIDGANVPTMVRLMSSVLVSDYPFPGTGLSIESANAVNVICQQSIANSNQDATVTLIPAGTLVVDPNVQ